MKTLGSNPAPVRPVRVAFGSTIVFALATAASAQEPRSERSASLRVAQPNSVAPLAVPGRFDGAGPFFPDPHQGGGAESLHLVELVFGRLVEVHELDASGGTSARPVYEDLVVNENVQSDGSNYRLETNPATQRTRLVILRRRGEPEPFPGAGTFEDLLETATSNLPSILPKAANAPPPFSLAPRNATLMARFDDLLDDDAQAAVDLFQTVKVFTGVPPFTPFAARIMFDENHGGIAAGAFHSTRVLVDLTVSELEAASLAVPLPVNLLGLPASDPGSAAANVELRLPTQIDFGSGQFIVLTNLSGRPLALSENGPFDPNSPTLDLVRAARSGNEGDPNSGFLLDLDPPQLLGAWPATLDSLVPTGSPGSLEFLASLTFTTACRQSLRPGDVLLAAGAFLEVVDPGSGPGAGGAITNARLRALHPRPLGNPAGFLGLAQLLTPFDPSAAVAPACWVTFAPNPTAPGIGVSPSAQVLARYSEPIEPASVHPFDSFRIVRGDAAVPAGPTNLVVGDTSSSASLDAFSFSPFLPLAHAQGLSEVYHVEIAPASAAPCNRITDLAGNALAATPGSIEFTLDAQAPDEANGGVVLRFASQDELAPFGFNDLRGQVFYDLACGTIVGRPGVFYSEPVDRSNPVPSIMIPFPPGVQTPLNPLGAKLQSVWRYVDAGWNVRDETQHNVDVVGLNWAPVWGQVVADNYPEFEIRLAHASKQPDEDLDGNLLPKYPNSGLNDAPSPFTSNILVDPLSPQKVVHPRALGYVVNPADLFVSMTGTPLMPYPLNRGPGPLVTYTWRDTAVLAEGAPNGAGIPLDIEAGPPLGLEPSAGTVAPSGEVPSFGLPLLLEFRCYPADTAIGLNAFDVSLAINSSARPHFRAFSAGGFNTAGFAVPKDPDLEPVPTGGFNPISSPPGKPTLSADDLFYVGQLDLVIRVSRAHSIWIDTGSASPDYAAALLEADAHGSAAQVVAEFRGASGFVGAGNAPFDASQLDPYGDVGTGSVSFLNGVATWSGNVSTVDGARYIQVRLSFLNDLQLQETAELSSLGLAFLD